MAPGICFRWSFFLCWWGCWNISCRRYKHHQPSTIPNTIAILCRESKTLPTIPYPLQLISQVASRWKSKIASSSCCVLQVADLQRRLQIRQWISPGPSVRTWFWDLCMEQLLEQPQLGLWPAKIHKKQWNQYGSQYLVQLCRLKVLRKYDLTDAGGSKLRMRLRGNIVIVWDMHPTVLKICRIECKKNGRRLQSFVRNPSNMSWRGSSPLPCMMIWSKLSWTRISRRD